jgi:hypothetical protein
MSREKLSLKKKRNANTYHTQQRPRTIFFFKKYLGSNPDVYDHLYRTVFNAYNTEKKNTFTSCAWRRASS